MEKYTMLMDWKNQYSENKYTSQSNLQIQCDPYQITNGTFHRSRRKNFTIHMETQMTPVKTSSTSRVSESEVQQENEK